MRKIITYFAISILFIQCEHKSDNAGLCFFRFLNEKKIDSLDLLLDNDFKLSLLYTNYIYSRDEFMNRRVNIIRENNELYFADTCLYADNDSVKYLVTAKSDYESYLHVPSRQWIYTFAISNNSKISGITIDTGSNGSGFFKEIKLKSDSFHVWLRNKYMIKTPRILYDTPGLILKRLKEYNKL